MLQTLSQNAGDLLPEELIDQLIKLVGTNPFYLQILGGELCSHRKLRTEGEESLPLEDVFKVIIQENLFSAVGKYPVEKNIFG